MRFIYEFVGNYGLSIMIFSILAKLVTLPITLKQKRSMVQTQRIQPKIKELQRKYGKDREKLNEEMQKLYDNEGVSPMAGCGTTLLAFPIMIGLYYVISQPLTYFMQLSSNQITQVAERLGHTMGSGYTAQIQLAGLMYDKFDLVRDISDRILRVDFDFGPINLAATPNFKEFGIMWLVPVISALTALASALVMQRLNKKNGLVQEGQPQIMLLLLTPAMSLYFGFILPAGLGLYWITNNILTVVQDLALQGYIRKSIASSQPQNK
jgi:YidC/Oxa1 family membrane protein insertase